MHGPRDHDDPHLDLTTDEVLSESVERVRSSRQLLDQIDQRLARSEEILAETDRR